MHNYPNKYYFQKVFQFLRKAEKPCEIMILRLLATNIKDNLNLARIFDVKIDNLMHGASLCRMAHDMESRSPGSIGYFARASPIVKQSISPTEYTDIFEIEVP